MNANDIFPSNTVMSYIVKFIVQYCYCNYCNLYSVLKQMNNIAIGELLVNEWGGFGI